MSACIIAFNEGDRIGACIESLTFCDEVLVVDSHSTDKTREVAAGLGARVIERDWPGHVAQKEFAIRAAEHDWVLCVDADERISPALRGEIERLAEQGFQGFAGWDMPRLSSYLGRFIRHGTWYPDRSLRLFDRRRGAWGGYNPHDRVELQGPRGRLSGELLHHPYRSLDEHVENIAKYTTIMADELHKQGRRARIIDVLARPPARFIVFYLLRRGFLDGWRGLLMAVLASYYVFLKYAKLYVRRRSGETGAAVLLAAALCLLVAGSSCGGHRAKDEWSLTNALLRCGEIEVLLPADAHETGLQARMGLLAEELERGGRWRVRILREGEKNARSSGRGARVLIGDRRAPFLAEPLKRLEVDLSENGFVYANQIYAQPEDRLVATFEDPERPGLPVSIAFANDARFAGLGVADLTPSARASVRCYQGGELDFAAELTPLGKRVEGTSVPLREARNARFFGGEFINHHTIAFFVPDQLDRSPLEEYARRAHAAQVRAFELLSSGDSPGGPVPILARVHRSAEEIARASGRWELGVAAPILSKSSVPLVDVLLVPGLPDDGGAAIALSSALATAGPPHADWLPDALALHIADSWWGVDLDRWVAHISSGGLVPPLRTLIGKSPDGERISQHIVQPARAAFLRYLLRKDEGERLKKLWKREKPLTVGKRVREGFRQWLLENQTSHKAELKAAHSARREEVLARPFRHGVALVEGDLEVLPELGLRTGYGSSACIERTEQARALGADALAWSVFCFLDRGLAECFGTAEPWPRATSSDLALLASIAARPQLPAMLSLHMLDTRSGTWSGYSGIGTAAEWEAYFASLRRLVIHYGLLGELAGCEILSLGSDQRNATYTKRREENRPDWEALVKKHEAWNRVIHSARVAFTGGLTYAASHENQPAEIEFWSELDFVGCDVFDPVVAFENPSLAIDRDRALALIRWNLEELLETARRNERPLLLTSLGYPATSYARFAPLAAPGEFDPAAQAWLYDVFASALEDVRGKYPDRMAGLYAWCLPIEPGRSRMVDLFSPQSEAARAALRRIFAAP